jgi:hypothetical protein
LPKHGSPQILGPPVLNRHVASILGFGQEIRPRGGDALTSVPCCSSYRICEGLPQRRRRGVVGATQRLGSGRGVLVYAARGDPISPLRVYVQVIVPSWVPTWVRRSCRNYFSCPRGCDMTSNKTYSYPYSTRNRYPFSVCRKPLLSKEERRQVGRSIRRDGGREEERGMAIIWQSTPPRPLTDIGRPLGGRRRLEHQSECATCIVHHP